MVTSAPSPFREVSEQTALDFRHVNGATGAFFFPEIMGSGAALFDYDNDGDLDAYLVQGGSLGRDGASATDRPRNRLFRNQPVSGDVSLRFEDVTEAAGVDDPGYGMGVAVGDYDGNGFLDLFVTNFGPNALYRNEGNGEFTDVSRAAGVDDPRWGTSAAFLDFDRDGHLDLFVVNYVDFKTSDNAVCRPAGVRDYCHPSQFEPQIDLLYRNLGDGTFEDVTSPAGIDAAHGSGLGVAVADLDGDGWLDLYVANDGNENQLWRNEGDGTFENVALFQGVALNGDGAAEAGMGVAAEDFDLDGDIDLFVTHLRGETNTLYLNQGDGYFEDATFRLGLGYTSLASTGFGVEWLDYDNDGFSDLFCANGAVALAREAGDGPSPYAEPNHLFRSLGGREFEVVDVQGPLEGLNEVSRGAAFGDLDNDGDVDVLLSNNGGPARVLLNQVGAQNHWVAFRLRASQGDPHAMGARVTLVRADGARPSKRVRADGSYCSANDLRVHFGLGNEATVTAVEVAWPGGDVEVFSEVAIDRYHELIEGEGTPRGE